jgi:soluble lytic murein transglycosylase-like protein
VSDSPPHIQSPARRHKTQRLGLIALGLIATLSILGGQAPIGDLGEVGVSTRPAGTPPAEFNANWVAAEVQRVNPTLSDPELDRIGAAVMRCGERHGLDPVLVTAVLRVESGGRPWARSPKGATGLMQVMPHMFGSLEVAGNLATIESNIGVGCLILADNIRRLGEDDGILAYFWGSNIRGDRYLERVRAARAALREPRETES